MASIYTPRRLIARCRSLANDKIDPYFISDEEYLDFLTEASREAARELLCLPSAEQEVLSAQAGTSWLFPSENLIKPRHLVYEDGHIVRPEPASTLERLYGDESAWQRETARQADVVVTDLMDGAWYLFPTPTEDAPLSFVGWVYPPFVTEVDDALELPDEVAQYLYLGMLAQAFMVEDADGMYDAEQGRNYLARWEDRKRRLLGMWERDRRDGGRSIRYGGY
jgi:hypothetical protein